MRNKLYIFIIAVAVPFLVIQCNNEKRLHQELVKMAENLNNSAPAHLDDHTVFLGAEVSADNTFQYRYQVINTADPQAMMQAVETQTRAQIKEAFQLNPDLQIFKNNNLNIDYIYTDSIGNTLKIIKITPKDYK